MIPKSGNRFSDTIMRQQNDPDNRPVCEISMPPAAKAFQSPDPGIDRLAA
jgi:hypothetical protein